MNPKDSGGVDLRGWVSDDNARARLREDRIAARAGIDRSHLGRADLTWSRKAYVEGFFFGYDAAWCDPAGHRFDVDRYLDDGEKEFGGYDVLVLWQPYPRMGIDARTQIDFFRDWPGGADGAGLREFIARCHARGVRCLLNHIRWDLSRPRTWKQDMVAYGRLLADVDADGVYLDTLSVAPAEVREALDRVRPGMLIEAENNSPLAAMPVQGMCWSQGHDPTPLVPFVQPWIDPRFMIRMVNRGADDHRPMIAKALFWGHGFCVWENVFGWWNPMKAPSRAMLRKTAAVLRAYHDFYLDPDWEPLPANPAPGVFANAYRNRGRTLLTLLNTTDAAVSATLDLAGVAPEEPWRAFDIWNAAEVQPTRPGGSGVSVSLEPRGCGAVVVQPASAAKPELAPQVRAYAPSMDMHIGVHPAEPGAMRITRSTGKAVEEVVRTADEQRLLVPETAFRTRVTLDALHPRPAAPPASAVREVGQMLPIPGGRWVMGVRHTSHMLEGGCYGDPTSMAHPPQHLWLEPYRIDRTPVTRDAYAAFLRAGGYRPAVMVHFLDGWTKRDPADPATWTPPAGTGDHPVVGVDLEDARAYAAWAGKQLPTEPQWQFAAQGPAGLAWPWGEVFEPGRCNHDTASTTPVNAYPSGASPFGVLDMAGNAWEWTESERHDGHTRFAVLKGGSHLVRPPGDHPEAWGKMWYTADGAQPNDTHQKMLLISPSLDRCGTVGFRCAAKGR